MARDMLFLESIDDYLGPSEGRFFARGYQRAEYRVTRLACSAATDSPQVRARLDVRYPADWSSKNGVDQRPHLSTVDALVLAVQLAELHLAVGNGLTAAERSAAVLRRAVLRAGGAPQEDLLDIPLSAQLARHEPSGSGELSVYRCAVGQLSVQCEIEHPGGTGEVGTHLDGTGLETTLGPATDRFYGSGFARRRHHVRAVQVDMASLTARAAVHFDTEPGTAVAGMGGARQPSVELVDAFVVCLQLAQVLMYELDSLSRAESNTLWMMQTVLTAPDSVVPLPQHADRALPATVELHNPRRLPLRGGMWRTVEIRGQLAGVALRSTFAHELPTSTAAVPT